MLGLELAMEVQAMERSAHLQSGGNVRRPDRDCRVALWHPGRGLVWLHCEMFAKLEPSYPWEANIVIAQNIQ